MSALIRVAFATPSPTTEVVSSYDVGRELQRLALLLMSDNGAWIELGGGPIVLEPAATVIGDWRIEEDDRTSGTSCVSLPFQAEHRGLRWPFDAIVHNRCDEYRDGTVTRHDSGEIVSEPNYYTPRGRIRV